MRFNRVKWVSISKVHKTNLLSDSVVEVIWTHCWKFKPRIRIAWLKYSKIAAIAILTSVNKSLVNQFLLQTWKSFWKTAMINLNHQITKKKNLKIASFHFLEVKPKKLLLIQLRNLLTTQVQNLMSLWSKRIHRILNFHASVKSPKLLLKKIKKPNKLQNQLAKKSN